MKYCAKLLQSELCILIDIYYEIDMDIKLPTFKYHPIKTGSSRQVICSCCKTKQHYKYTGPIYSLKEPSENICLFCIADGSSNIKIREDYRQKLKLKEAC